MKGKKERQAIPRPLKTALWSAKDPVAKGRKSLGASFLYVLILTSSYNHNFKSEVTSYYCKITWYSIATYTCVEYLFTHT